MNDVLLKYLAQYWNAAIEILLLAVLFYRLYLLFRGTRMAKMIKNFLFFFILFTLVSQILNLSVISWLLRSLTAFLLLGFVVVFQPEVRRMLSSGWLSASTTARKQTIDVITETAFELSSRQIGALIAIERGRGIHKNIRGFDERGVELDSKISKELLLTIFSLKSPMHDGGVIVRGDRLLAAACTFPVSQREDFDHPFGQRHRAGLGLSEEFDAIALVVSEETGHISICENGRIERGFRPGQLETRLSELL